MNYMINLYKEYINTLNVRSNEKKEKEGFYYWLEENKNILKYYEFFLQSLNLTPYKGVVEVNKNIIDSILPYMPYDTKCILVSPYVKTEKINKNSATINGVIGFKDKELYQNGIKVVKKVPAICHNTKMVDVNFLNFTTHFPIDKDTLNIMKELIKLDKNVFIGLYGRMVDKNRIERLRELYNIKNSLEEELNKNIEGEYIETNNYYMAAITPKLRYKDLRDGLYGR